MSTTTTIYMDQNINGKEVKLPIILNEIKNGLNELIKKSYDDNNVIEKEGVGRIPFIRNASMVKSFSYEPQVHEEYAYQSLRANFNVFVEPQYVGGFSQHQFRMVKDDAKVSHQARTVSILTDNNHDASNHLDSVNENNNNFISISMGGDIVGQKLMKQLAQHINEKLGCDTYYQRVCSEENVEKITKTKSVSKKVKP